jgi:hypothetical protein
MASVRLPVTVGLSSMFRLGVVESGRLPFWGLFFWALALRPRQFSTAITLAIYGFHFRRVYALHA